VHLMTSDTIAIGFGYWRCYAPNKGGIWEIYLGPWVLCLAKKEDMP